MSLQFFPIGGRCATCDQYHDREGQRLCASCHAEYQRQWRRKRTRQYRAAVREVSRAEARVGMIPRGPCTVCGDPDVELHHPDHEVPDITVWMRRRCHVNWHNYWRETVLNTFCWWLEMARECDIVRKREDAREASEREAATGKRPSEAA